jgi:hypothetical protein
VFAKAMISRESSLLFRRTKARRWPARKRSSLCFTEKDHSKDAQPDLKALFGDYGSALVVGSQPDGKIATCDVAPEALKQKPISSPTSATMSDFKNEGGQISGKIATDGKQEAFGQTWEINLIFKTKAP